MEKKCFIFIILLMTQIITGCNFFHNPISTNADQPYQYKCIDSRGKELIFTQKPHRIASLHYSTDEILLDLVAADRIKSVSRSGKNETLCNNAEKAKLIDTTEENIEFIIANNIDLLIIRENYDKNFIEQAEKAGINVFVVANPKSVSEIEVLIRKLAEAVDEKAQGEKLIVTMTKNLEAVKNNIGVIPIKNQKTALVISSFGASSLQGTIVDDIFKYAQIRNAAAKVEKQLPKNSKTYLSKEQIVACDPDYLLLISTNMAYLEEGDEKLLKSFNDDPSLSTLTAIREKHLLPIPMRYTICFSHYISQNILSLSNAVYGKRDGGIL